MKRTIELSDSTLEILRQAITASVSRAEHEAYELRRKAKESGRPIAAERGVYLDRQWRASYDALDELQAALPPEHFEACRYRHALTELIDMVRAGSPSHWLEHLTTWHEVKCRQWGITDEAAGESLYEEAAETLGAWAEKELGRASS